MTEEEMIAAGVQFMSEDELCELVELQRLDIRDLKKEVKRLSLVALCVTAALVLALLRNILMHLQGGVF